MNKLSNILGKAVISIYNGQVEGTIISTIFDKKLQKIKGFILFSDFEEENINENRVLFTKDIFNLGQDALVIKNDACLENISTLEPTLRNLNPINREIYTALGNKIGTIMDVNFDEKYNIIEFELKESENKIHTNQIASWGNDIIIMQDDNKKINISNFAVKKPKVKETKEIIKIQRSDTLNKDMINSLNNQLNTTLPLKLTATADILLGRLITENLYSQSKEIIAKKGAIINPKIIETARKYGKIKELYIFSM